MSTLYSVGQMNQLGDSLEAEGFTADDVTRLKQFSNLAGFKTVVNGTAKIVPITEDANRVVTLNATTIAANLGATPKLPFNGTQVEEHIGRGWVIVEKRADGLYVDGKKFTLHLSKRQKNGKWIKGYELREELTGKPVLNTNILDAILIHTHLLPENWEKDENGNTRYIFFWGTIYRGSSGDLYVRCLYFFRGGGWRSSYDWLGIDWHGSNPAALLAS